jgi:hypothetical protein
MGLLPSLLADLRAVCATFPDPRKGRSGNIAMADFGLAAFVQIPAHRGQSFRRIADSVPVIADSF